MIWREVNQNTRSVVALVVVTTPVVLALPISCVLPAVLAVRSLFDVLSS